MLAPDQLPAVPGHPQRPSQLGVKEASECVLSFYLTFTAVCFTPAWGACRASGVAVLGRGPTSCGRGGDSVARPSEAAWGHKEEGSGSAPDGVPRAPAMVGCADGTGKAPLSCPAAGFQKDESAGSLLSTQRVASCEQCLRPEPRWASEHREMGGGGGRPQLPSLGQKNRPSASLVMFSSMFMASLITDVNLSPWRVRIVFLCGTCIRREEKQGAEVAGE